MKPTEIFARAVALVSGKGKPARADVDCALQECEAREKAATAELERLATTRPTVLVEGSDADLENHGAAITRATLDRDRAGAIAVKLRERLETIIAAEADAERVRRRGEVELQAELAADELRRRYPKVVAEVRSLLRTTATAQAAIAAFAAAYPTEAAIADPERTARTTSSVADTVVSETRLWRWVFVAGGAPLKAAVLNEVRLKETQEERDLLHREKVQEGRGHVLQRTRPRSLEVTAEIYKAMEQGHGRQYEFETATARAPVRYVQMVRREVERFAPPNPPAPLATSIAVPGLLPSDAGWSPPAHHAPTADHIVHLLDASMAPMQHARTRTVVEYVSLENGATWPAA